MHISFGLTEKHHLIYYVDEKNIYRCTLYFKPIYFAFKRFSFGQNCVLFFSSFLLLSFFLNVSFSFVASMFCTLVNPQYCFFSIVVFLFLKLFEPRSILLQYWGLAS